jgi:hypothetical protein
MPGTGGDEAVVPMLRTDGGTGSSLGVSIDIAGLMQLAPNNWVAGGFHAVPNAHFRAEN